jgi:hypothetical protein
MTTPLSPGPDPFACREELELALAVAELDIFESDQIPVELSLESRRAAYALAVAIGRCRLFDVNVGELDGTLPTPIALAAAEQLVEFLQGWIADARSLRKRWDEAAHPIEAEELCLELVEARMEAWACWVALDEAFACCLDENDTAVSCFTETVEKLLRLLAQLDTALEAEKPLLATAADTELLNNWRTFLADSFKEVPPWWLDGTLERVAQENHTAFVAELPGVEAWARLRQSIIEDAVSVQALPSERPRSLLPPLVSMAAAPIPQSPRVIWWESRDAKHKACLALPPTVTSDEQRVILSFFTATYEPATDLADAPIRLAGVAGTIDADGNAAFRVMDLRNTGQDLVLEVGAERTSWLPR